MQVTAFSLPMGSHEENWPAGIRIMGVCDLYGPAPDQYSDQTPLAGLIVLVPDEEGDRSPRYFNVVKYGELFPEHPNDNNKRTWQYIGTTVGGLTVFENVAVPDPLHHLWTCGPAGTMYHGAVAAKALIHACAILAKREQSFRDDFEAETGKWKSLKICGSRDEAKAWWNDELETEEAPEDEAPPPVSDKEIDDLLDEIEHM